LSLTEYIEPANGYALRLSGLNKQVLGNYEHNDLCIYIRS